MDSIFNQLRDNLSPIYVNLIEQEFYEIRKSFKIEDETKIGIHCGRLCELMSSILCFEELEQAEDLNKINFNNNITKLETASKTTPKEELNRLVIPRVLRALYTIRSKKKIAHIKTIKPQRIDIKFIKTSVDWLLSQLVLLYCNLQDKNILNFLEKIAYEEYKKVERFDNGEILFHNPKMPFSEKLLIVLLENYNNGRINKKKIYDILKPKNKSYITTYINNFKKRNLIHETNEGVKLTKWGIAEAQKLLIKLEF